MNAIERSEPQTINVFGDQAIMDFMLTRTAAIFQVPKEDMQYPDVQGALIKAAQLCWTYGAMPGRHVHLLPFNKLEKVEKNGKTVEVWRKSYAVSDAYEWRKASADIKANQNRTRYMVQTVEMTPAEVAAYVAGGPKSGPVHVNDRGFKARVLFAHEMEIIAKAQALGMKDVTYDPAWHYGFWRQNAKEKSNGTAWDADTVPNGRTRDWVALKRAEKSALAEHFELRSLQGWESKSEAAKMAAIEDATPEPVAQGRASDRALFANRMGAADIDDWMADEPVKSAADDLLPDAEFKELEPLDFNPPPPDLTGPQLSEKEKLTFEVNRLGKQLYGNNWRDFKSPEFALWASGKNTDDLKQLGTTELEKIAVQLRTKASTTGK